MPLLDSAFTVLDDLASRFAAESIFAAAGSDEGMIPAAEGADEAPVASETVAEEAVADEAPAAE